MDVCRGCKTYLMCLDGGEILDLPSPGASALSMLTLEMQARAQGYSPLAFHPWNRLV
jgi:FdhE protein